MKKIILFTLFITALNVAATAQGTDGTLIDPNNATTRDASAVFQAQSTSQGMLTPRMTAAQRAAIPVSAARNGLLVYQTDATAGFYYYTGSAWVLLANTTTGAPPTGPAGGDLTGTYPNPTIATDAVTTAKILDNTITTNDILNGTILNADIANNAINSAKIQDGTVSSADIANGTIATIDIANDAVDNTKLANMAANTIKGAITAGDPQDLSAAQILGILNTDNLYVKKAGDVMTGKLTLANSYPNNEGVINLPNIGTANPTASINGDLWFRSNTLFFNNNGTARQVAHTGSWAAMSVAEGQTATATTSRFMRSDYLKQIIEYHAPNVTLAGENYLSLSGQQLTANPITSAHITDGTITSADILNGTVSSADIANGTIATADIANNAIDGTKIGIGTTNGDMLYYNGTDWLRLGAGANGTVLKVAGGIPSWGTDISGADNLGNHTATTTLAMGTNAITSSAGTRLDGDGGWIRTYGNTGWYNGTHAGGWFMQDATWIRNYNSKNVYINTFLRADGGIASGNVTSLGAGTIHATSQIRGTIFYDYDNTAYYVDPASNSIINTIRIAGGTPGAGKVLTSDATGNATWQTPTGGSIQNQYAESLAASTSTSDTYANKITLSIPAGTWAITFSAEIANDWYTCGGVLYSFNDGTTTFGTGSVCDAGSYVPVSETVKVTYASATTVRIQWRKVSSAWGYIRNARITALKL